MSDRACKNCRWYARWPDQTPTYWDGVKQGVCIAPRPHLGPEPQREVSDHDGKRCSMFGRAVQEVP